MKRAILVLTMAAACSGGGGKGAGGNGGTSAGGSGGDTAGGGSGGTVVTADASTGGGSGGGSGGGGSGGGGSGAVDGRPSDAPAPVVTPDGGAVSGWYEAEAIPPNEKAPRSEVHVNPARACATIPPKPGESCQAGGGQVTWITEGRKGWLQFNQVSAPADGMYDVTWWYHCGNNDHFGDRHCGGQTNPPTTSSGCRPHQIVVNGMEMPGTYHWPCFPGPFSEIHAVTTVLPLKAGGTNTIKVYPKERDSADMDAIHIQPLGKGIGPLIMSNNVSGSN